MNTTPINGTHEAHIPDKARYLSIQDTKKLLMSHVRAAFPKKKFSFRTHINNLSVEWTNGPSWSRMKKITDIFTSRGFIDNNDHTSAIDTWYNGELVYFGNEYIELLHHFSHEAVEIVTRKYQEWANCEPFTIIDGPKGSGIDWTHPFSRVGFELREPEKRPEGVIAEEYPCQEAKKSRRKRRDRPYQMPQRGTRCLLLLTV